uniref:Uncharacterized protein n=1 Tax=Anguilla anguilla TaxID=7936 RepID=A0A0E9T6V9_ANGAN
MARAKAKRNCPRSKAPLFICETWWWGRYGFGMLWLPQILAHLSSLMTLMK